MLHHKYDLLLYPSHVQFKNNNVICIKQSQQFIKVQILMSKIVNQILNDKGPLKIHLSDWSRPG